MQEALRAEAAPHMYERDYAHFVEEHNTGKLVKPADSGHIIAALALNATHDLSGEFVSWNADRLQAYRADESHL
jgi:hypothetical protein